MAFRRHSTSKLSSADDLSRIVTLGFRGEALASIAAVSRVTFLTRARDEETGVLLRLEGGQVVSRQPSGRPPGTTVTIRDLFYNVPARLEFLRTEATERRHIDAWITRYAIAYPDLRFTLSHNGRVTFRSPGNGNLRDALVGIYGAESAAAFLEIEAAPGNDVVGEVRGLVSPPSLHRANRSGITLFINGRWIQNSRLTYAVIQAYHTLLPVGRYPLAVVLIGMPLEPVPYDVVAAQIKEARVEHVFRYAHVYPRALALMGSGKIDFRTITELARAHVAGETKN
jgi:DNA mismatch repair protein MutL